MGQLNTRPAIASLRSAYRHGQFLTTWYAEIRRWWGLSSGDLESELSNEKRAPGWLGYIRDEILPSYIETI